MFQESEMSAGLHSWNLILGIECCRLPIRIVDRWHNRHSNRVWPWRSEIVSRQWSVYMNLLLKTIDRRDRKPNFVIFVVSSAVTLSRWVVLVLSRKSYLGPAEIASYVFLSNSTPPFPHSLKQVQETYEPGFE